MYRSFQDDHRGVGAGSVVVWVRTVKLVRRRLSLLGEVWRAAFLQLSLLRPKSVFVRLSEPVLSEDEGKPKAKTDEGKYLKIFLKNYCINAPVQRLYPQMCRQHTLYTGITNELYRRLDEHENGRNPQCYTFNRRPVQLLFQQDFHFVQLAIAFEKQVKGWSRKKKEALIAGEIDLL